MTDEDRAAGDRAAEPARPGSLALPYAPQQLPDLLSLPFLGGAELSEHFGRLEEIGRRRPEREPALPALVLPGQGALSVEDSLELGEEGEDLLEDARANIARGEYPLALEQLAEFIEISPGHPEARYLSAYCHYRLGGAGLMTALGVLRPMRDEPLEDPELRTGVRDLRAKLRVILTQQEMAAFLDASPRDPRAAADRLRRFIELAPEEPEPQYLLAVTQAQNGEFESALRTTKYALRQAEGNTGQLRVLAEALETVVVRTLAGPAVRALRDGAYRRARENLARVDREWRETEVLRDLDAFLSDLCERGHPPAKRLPPPRGPADRAARLYALISDEDGRESVQLLIAGRFAEAERVLARMLHVVPRFPVANFIYAICLCVQGREPERAIAAAEIAAGDPSLPDTGQLLRTAREMSQVLAINAAVEEHNAAVEAVSEKPSRQELADLERRMRKLRQRLPEVQSMATTRQSAARVRQLAKAVDQRLKDVEQAMESVDVPELVLRFNRWAEQAASVQALYDGGMPGSPRADGLRSSSRYVHGGFGADRESLLDMDELRSINRKARQLLRTAADPRARKVLQDLLNATDRIIR
ncbi:tetratricopeptide repeat protein [Actinomadura decatromicini]|uniref:Tetratricopeptide repeat protein n=1 Tax=Actinomadura decatromicini TaxID=2604572 RepID=A0A5D3F652_9ACTN|nr:tetratricopeptide repeat protein [Actinomadura decatromicini]TYK43653.1 tetratricopeptide repeat protein [Actinomadura decatromicini]